MGGLVEPIKRRGYENDKGLYHAEVMAGCFGWRPCRKLRNEAGEYSCGHNFRVLRHERKRFQANKVSISRACSQLQERGLVECWVGLAKALVTLTDKGWEWLSVNQPPR
jgi:hypothetical protein